MKRIPTRIFWETIGDFFTYTILDDRRRSIEGFWQAMADQAADALEYARYYQNAKSVFKVEPYAPYGSFWAEVTLVDTEASIEGFLIGLDNQYKIFSNDPIPNESGAFRIESANYNYFSGSSTELLSGGNLISFSTGTKLQPQNNPSSLFDRFQHTGSRNSFDLDWVNVAIFKDTEYIDGSQSWKQVYRFNIDNWDLVSNDRILSIHSMGDIGPDYEVRLTDDGSEISVSFGQFARTSNIDLTYSGSSITRVHGTWTGDGFEAGQNITVTGSASNDGNYTVTGLTASTLTVAESFVSETSFASTVLNNLEEGNGDSSSWRSSFSGPIEFVLEYDATTSRMSGEVFFGNSSVKQNFSYPVSAGRRVQSVLLLNQKNNVKITPEFLFSTGKIWGKTAYDYTTDIGSEFSYVYEMEEPLIEARSISTEPWPLSQKADVLKQSPSRIEIEKDEEYAGYIPEYSILRNNDGTFSTAKWMGTYFEPISYIPLDSEITVEPWNDSEIVFDRVSKFRLRKPIPSRGVWFKKAKAVELDMYSRYGQLLQMPKRDDSWQYLNALRGMQYGLKKSATEHNLSTAIGVMTGLPYSTEEGVISSITLAVDDLGKPIHYNVIVNGKRFEVSTYWKDHLKPTGASINFLDLFVDGVKIFDWKSNPELCLNRFGDWGQWGGMVVQIPTFIGINATMVGDILRLLNRSKSVHSDFRIEYKGELKEGRFEKISYDFAETIVKAKENLSFDGGDSVIQRLDEGRLLDTGHVLDGLTITPSGRTSSLLFVDQPQDTNRQWIETLSNTGLRYGDVQDSRNMFAVGDADQIFVSNNLGKNWISETVNGGTGGSFSHCSKGVACQGSSFVWVRSTDGIWNSKASPIPVDFVIGDLPNIIAVTASTGEYVSSDDSGDTWGAVNNLPDTNIRNVRSFGVERFAYMSDNNIREYEDGTFTVLDSAAYDPSFVFFSYDGVLRDFGAEPMAAYNGRGWKNSSGNDIFRTDYVTSVNEATLNAPIRQIVVGVRGVFAITDGGIWIR